MKIGSEEGDLCGRDRCCGILAFCRGGDGTCSCHLYPPCSNCENSVLSCPACGREVVEDEVPDPCGPFLRVVDPYKDRPLDPAKIDYRVKALSNSSMICEGVYPEWADRARVELEVRGTFGGRFESFGNGKFKYIAYTD